MRSPSSKASAITSDHSSWEGRKPSAPPSAWSTSST
ncbi:hypothetical protein CVT25_001190 [Psilocybe cyanescens]|uniref:Uncharacterized protein n=1 Tax=Psilocybe cyanescens TaxID=93625 RepID=A0A409XMG5_PSICY|nr:hypothetical protein CVT25_001190 [Psilocybe cyanescens]